MDSSALSASRTGRRKLMPIHHLPQTNIMNTNSFKLKPTGGIQKSHNQFLVGIYYTNLELVRLRTQMMITQVNQMVGFLIFIKTKNNLKLILLELITFHSQITVPIRYEVSLQSLSLQRRKEEGHKRFGNKVEIRSCISIFLGSRSTQSKLKMLLIVYFLYKKRVNS